MALAGPAANMKARLLGAIVPRGLSDVGGDARRAAAHAFLARAGKLRLHLPHDLAFLAGEHLEGRLEQLAGVAGIKSSEIVAGLVLR